MKESSPASRLSIIALMITAPLFIRPLVITTLPWMTTPSSTITSLPITTSFPIMLPLIPAPETEGRFKGSIIGKDVVIGKEVMVEEGVVIQGKVVITRGRINKGAVIINAIIDNLEAGEDSLTYNVDEPKGSILVLKRNLVSDVFIKRKVYLFPSGICTLEGCTYDIVTQDAKNPSKSPRILGRVVIKDGVIQCAPNISISIETANREDQSYSGFIKTKVRANLPLMLNAKDKIGEYIIRNTHNEALGQLVTVNGIVKDYVVFQPGAVDRLNKVLDAKVKIGEAPEDISIITKDDILYLIYRLPQA